MRNAVNSSSLISPAAIANSRWRMLPLPLTFPVDRHIVRRISERHRRPRPSISAAYEAVSSALPQKTRCLPSRHTSPGAVTAGPPGSAGSSSAGSGCCLPARVSPSIRRSISPISKSR